MNVRNKECQVTMWLPRLNLQIKDKVDLETDSLWLNDRHMNAAQKLLHEQFPTVSGLADTVLLSQGKCKYDPTNAVQILHMRGNHWVCVSTIGCPPDTIDVYDSLYSSLPAYGQEQLATILQTTGKHMIVRFPRMQHQVGGSDCGLFAVACAYELASGCNPSVTAWNQADMREHLKACFEDNEMTPFPLAARPRRLTSTKFRSCQKIRLYCSCRMPWNAENKTLGALVECAATARSGFTKHASASLTM